MSHLFKVASTTSTITPWRDWNEWQQCRADIFAVPEEAADSSSEPTSSILTRKRRALHTIDAWRGRGRVPLAIESTAQLTMLNLEHDYPPTAAATAAASSSAIAAAVDSPSTLHSRLQYSMCLLRLVNGVLDPLQSKSHAQSVTLLARHMHLPRVLVDLRHEATHQSLPSLPILQYASLQALEWLQRHYWTQQSHAITKVEDTIRQQLKEYKRGVENRRKKEVENSRSKGGKEEQQEENEEENVQQQDPSDTILLNPTSPAAASSSSSSTNTSSAMPDSSQEALRLLVSTLTSGHTAQATQTLLEKKLIPILLSEQVLIKTPKMSRVSLPLVFRRLLEHWLPALQYFAAKWRGGNNTTQHSFYTLLIHALVKKMEVEGGAMQSSSTATSASASTWHMDLMREWCLHLLRTQMNVMFPESTSHALMPTAPVTASKKRSHQSMMSTTTAESAQSSSTTSPLSDILRRCLRSINPWFAPLLPLLLPIFKQRHPNSAAMTQIEYLAHLQTKNFYPQFRIAQPNVSVVSNTQSSVTAVDLTAVKKLVQEHQSNSSSSAMSASSSSVAPRLPERIELMTDFPFLPIGLIPSNLDSTASTSLWLDDANWTNTSTIANISTLPAAVPASTPIISDSITHEQNEAKVDDSTDYADAMQIDQDEYAQAEEEAQEEEKQPTQQQHANKRARPSPAVEAASSSCHEQARLAQTQAVQRMQQAIGWM